MYFIVVCDENSFRSIKAFNERHTVFQPEGETGGGETVAVHRCTGDDRDLKEPVIVRVTGRGVKDMVITRPIYFKIAFVDAGGYDGLIGDGDGGNRFVFSPNGRCMPMVYAEPSVFAPSASTFPPRLM